MHKIYIWLGKFDPFFNVKWGYLTTKALYSLLFSTITDSKAGDNRCGSGLVLDDLIHRNHRTMDKTITSSN